MDNSFSKLIKQLHSRHLPDNVADKVIKMGRTAYDYLLVKIDDPNLTDYQVLNLLRILYQMKYHDIEQFINKLCFLSQDTRINVRSTASFLIICLFRLKKEFKELYIPLDSETIIKLLHNSLAMDLHQTVREQVESFIESI
ncbi:hypothetical protein [Aulosira sp. FACHB-615]|uniref:hypothetical protein n=1 Tax=Aulosira sp. FACHB-615 TaxID=2692777 RepID=UPI001689D727|nr:hypothetical protein [Aulosira sp. FACHB-615]MBD2491384.1 hypothetical protein [Aulosira sp. FACHB-615]